METVLEKKVLSLLSKKIKENFPETNIWLFGSRARGDGAEDSDYDIFILHNYLPEQSNILNDIVWEVGFDNDIFFSPIVISKHEGYYLKLLKTPLYRNILKEGIEIL
jgi:uncharacterized protein